MRRRIVGLSALLVAGLAVSGGCGSVSRPPLARPAATSSPVASESDPRLASETESREGEQPAPSWFPFSRSAVPDAVMLRDQINSGYRDTPGP